MSLPRYAEVADIIRFVECKRKPISGRFLSSLPCFLFLPVQDPSPPLLPPPWSPPAQYPQQRTGHRAQQCKKRKTPPPAHSLQHTIDRCYRRGPQQAPKQVITRSYRRRAFRVEIDQQRAQNTKTARQAIPHDELQHERHRQRRIPVQRPPVPHERCQARKQHRAQHLQSRSLNRVLGQVVAAFAIEREADVARDAAVVPVQELPGQDAGDAAGSGGGQVAEPDLEVVEGVDVGEEGGERGVDDHDRDVDEGVVDEDDGDVFFDGDGEAFERVWEAELWTGECWLGRYWCL